jgi:beta-glucosidase
MKYAGLVAGVISLGSLAGCGGGGGGGNTGGKGGGGGTSVVVPLCPATGGTTQAAAPPACSSNPSDYQRRFQDPCVPIEERITDLLAWLTPTEKLGLMSEYQFPVDRDGIQIPAFTTFTEGLHGIGWASNGSGAGTNNVLYMTGTQFPQTFGLAESWDPDAWKTVGATTAYEARVYNALRGINAQGRGVGVVVRAPLVDLGRDPRWGRTEESSGEDPYLVSKLAEGYIAGLHGDDPTYLLAASTLKHWLANNNETNRGTTSADFDPRNLREYYGAPFEHAIRVSRAQGIMEAYNKINGVSSATTPLIKSLLIGEWGFDGVLQTDAWVPGTLVNEQKAYPNYPEAIAAIVKAGTPLILQDDPNFRMNIDNAYNQGLMTVEEMDAALRGNLRVRFRVGDFDPPDRVPGKKILGTETPWNEPAAWAKALDVTRKSVVLLKNANNKLPLAKETVTTIAVVGPRANNITRDWYGGNPPHKVTVADGIRTKFVGTSVTITSAPDANPTMQVDAARAAGLTVLVLGNHPYCSDDAGWLQCDSPNEGREAIDRKLIEIEPAQIDLAKQVFAANPNTIVVLVSSYPQALGWIHDNIPAIVHIGNSGQELGTAITDVIFGDYNPAGRTTMTWYASTADLPTDMLQYDIRAGKGLTYQYFTGAPLYPFGHGLSFTTFAYSNLVVGASTLAACDETTVSVDVQNTGTRDGDEVVQLYASYPDSALVRPTKQLRGFKRIHLAAGAKQTVSFPLRGEALAYWNESKPGFAVEAGMVALEVGASSADIKLTGALMARP